MAVKLAEYDIIKGPVISDKAHKLNRTKNQLVLRVHPQANKPLIKHAIEKLFNVKVKEVRTLLRKKAKVRVAQKRFNATPRLQKTKIAYITLAKGHSLNLFDQAGGAPVSEISKQAHTES